MAIFLRVVPFNLVFRLSDAALLDKVEDNYNISAKDFKQFVRGLIGWREVVSRVAS
jgi:hypothetical protein